MENSSAKLSELKTPRKDAKSRTKHALHRNKGLCQLTTHLANSLSVYPLEIMIVLEKISERHLYQLICQGILQQTNQPTSLPVPKNRSKVVETGDAMRRALDKPLV
jgi:hypothetical protein